MSFLLIFNEHSGPQPWAFAILGSLLAISISVLILWSTFKNKTSEQQHHEVIWDGKIIFEPSQHSLHPLTVYHYCSELLLNMSSFSTKDQWNESGDLYPSENVGLVPIICFLIMITKRRFRYFLGRFSDFLAFHLPYPILLPLSFFYRLFKYLLVTLPMTCCSINLSIFLKCWNFFLWITYPLQFCARKGFEAFFFLFITLPWKIISWPWKIISWPSAEGVESRGKEEFDRGLEEYRKSLKKIEEDAEKEKEFKERENQVNKSLEEAERKLSEFRNRSMSEEESSEEENEERRQDEEEFRRKLEEPNRVHEEILKVLREKRAEIEVMVTGIIGRQRKAAEELQC